MSGLALNSVTKQFGTFTAVNSVQLNVPHGTFVCMLGPSGCGKTTLLRMIAGLDSPTGGAIVLDDEDITRIPTHQRNLGMVFQSLALFPHLTVGENIAYPLRIRGVGREAQKKRVDELLAMIHLPGYADRPVSKLSGGQRQRVAIARALTLEPDVVVADEPTSALDVSVRAQILNLLADLKSELGLGMVFISHDIQTVRHISDEIVVMRGGRIVERGPAARVFSAPEDDYTRTLLAAAPTLL